ncbi:S41 family peptidase [Spongiimicrobium salis]|uniref:S41 family peptidase n=1 Tax=Spongiimicrobium salis TaxID=1667022 RepID=UPI00374D685B
MKNTALTLFLFCTSLLFAQIPNEISEEEKVYGLSKFWQEVNYNFVYLNKVDREAWDAMYKNLISEVQRTPNDYEYYRLLQKFCASLKDGHTNVYFPSEIQNNIYTSYFGEYRIFLSNIEGKAIITRVNESKKEELPLGTEIVKVNGVPVKEYIALKVRPFIASSTDHILEDWGIERMLQGYVGTSYEVEMRLPNGKRKTLRLTHAKTLEKEVYPPFEKRELLDIKWVGKDIAYVALNSFSDWKISSQFQERVKELKKAKKLIVDLRYNGGGNSNVGKEILKFLIKDTLLYGSRSQSRLHIPSFKAWGKWAKATDTLDNSWGKKAYLSYRDNAFHHFAYEADTVSKGELVGLKKDRLVVPTAVLIGHNTASAAEDFLIYADKQAHMTKIGEATFGSTGQPFLFDLPHGGVARVCTKKDTYPDGREFVGYGILPDIWVKKELQDYLKDKDPVLDRAIAFLKTQK